VVSSAPQIQYEFVRRLVNLNVEYLDDLPDHRLYVTHRDTKITEVFQGLIHHNFLSVPVVQKNAHKYLGFLDMVDIVRYIVSHFGKQRLSTSEDFWLLIEQENNFQKKTVQDLMIHPLSVRNPFVPVKQGSSLFHAFEILGKEPNVHRVPILDEDRILLNIITESQAVKFIHKNLPLLGAKGKMRVDEMTGLSKQVFTIGTYEDAIIAFDRMIQHKVSGLGVVDVTGKLVDNISVRDLKAISSDCRLFWRLYQTVGNFLQKIKTEKSRPHSIITCKESDTLEDVITRLVYHNIHRLFVVDEEKKPVSVVSLRDVIRELITNI